MTPSWERQELGTFETVKAVSILYLKRATFQYINISSVYLSLDTTVFSSSERWHYPAIYVWHLVHCITASISIILNIFSDRPCCLSAISLQSTLPVLLANTACENKRAIRLYWQYWTFIATSYMPWLGCCFTPQQHIRSSQERHRLVCAQPWHIYSAASLWDQASSTMTQYTNRGEGEWVGRRTPFWKIVGFEPMDSWVRTIDLNIDACRFLDRRSAILWQGWLVDSVSG